MVFIERGFQRRLVHWNSANESESIILVPGAAWNIYIPNTYTGTTLTIQVFVERELHDVAKNEGPINDWKAYDQGAVTFVKDQVTDLTPNSLFGIEKVRFVSNQSENCTGELTLSM